MTKRQKTKLVNGLMKLNDRIWVESMTECIACDCEVEQDGVVYDSIWFTPDYTEKGETDIQLHSLDGDSLGLDTFIHKSLEPKEFYDQLKEVLGNHGINIEKS